MINYCYYFFFKKTYKQIAYKFGRKNPIAIPDMYVLTLGYKTLKRNLTLAIYSILSENILMNGFLFNICIDK